MNFDWYQVWFVALVILSIVAMWSMVSFTIKFAYADEWIQEPTTAPKFECLKYGNSDGTLAVLDREYCYYDVFYKELDWFLKKGYVITETLSESYELILIR